MISERNYRIGFIFLTGFKEGFIIKNENVFSIKDFSNG